MFSCQVSGCWLPQVLKHCLSYGRKKGTLVTFHCLLNFHSEVGHIISFHILLTQARYMAKPDVNLMGNPYAERLLQRGKLQYLVTCSRYNSVLKSRDITLPTKVHIFKVTVFPGDTYSCESWTVEKAEHQRIDAFELWCWRRLLRVPWTVRRSNQPVSKEIDPEHSLEELMLKPKCQHSGHLM